MSERKLFIGSSGESYHIALELKEILLKEFPHLNIVTWKETKWANLKSVLQSLNKYTNEFYYSIFIGYPDDIVFERGEYHYISRDNVLFEFGYFLSVLGEDKTFLLLPESFNLSGKIPVQMSNVGLKKMPPLKILSDIGNNLITDRYSLVYEKTTYTDKSGKTIEADKWLTTKLEDEVKSLISNITIEEQRLNDLNVDTLSTLINSGKGLVRELRKIKCEENEPVINKFKKTLDELLILRSLESKKSICDTIIDITELIYKIEDLLDIEQLSAKQHYSKFKKVWVFADSPIEFDTSTPKARRELMHKTILENLENDVRYKYITSPKFNPDRIDSTLFAKLDDTKKEKYRKLISVVQVEPKNFKTYFTLHFSELDSTSPEEIYMSALIEKRDDLLIKVSPIHFNRVFERIDKIVGHKSTHNYYIRNFVVVD